MNNSIKRLRIEFSLLWLAALGTATLYHYHILPTGQLVNTEMAYWLDVATILLSISLAFFATRLFTLKTIRARITKDNPQGSTSYIKWSEVRMAMLTIPLFLSIATYYQTLNSNGLFCALIVGAATLFCWPSQKRMKHECRSLWGNLESETSTLNRDNNA